MQRPDAGVVGIKGDSHFRTWWNHEGIAYGAGYFFAVDFHNFEVMPMQMHRVSHVGRDGKGNSDAFAASDIERLAVGIGSTVNRPNIGSHVSAKRCGQSAVDGTVGKRI